MTPTMPPVVTPHRGAWPAPERGRYEVRGLELAYHVWDLGAPKVLLLLHGFGDHGLSYAPMVRSLSHRFCVVAPDLRGHGHSGWVGAGGSYAFHDYFHDVRCLLDHLGVDRVFVVGHSMGGGVAAGLAAMSRGRVDRIVLLEGMGPPFHLASQAVERLVRWSDVLRGRDVDQDVEGRRRARRPIASIDEAVHRLMRANRRLSPLIARELAESFTEPLTSSADGALAWRLDPLHRAPSPRGYLFEDAKLLWASVTCPVLSVYGRRSPFVDATLPERHACLEDVTVSMLAEAGHNLHHERPEDVAAIVEWWMDGGGGPRPSALE